MPTFVNAGTPAFNSGGGTTVTLGTPSPVTAGNLLVALINAGGVTLVSTPADWTYVSDNMASGFFGLTVAWRVATGTEVATYAWGVSAVTGNVEGVIVQYSNAALDGAPSYNGGGSAASSFTFNSVTPTAANDTWLKYVGGSWNSGSPDTISSPGGTSQLVLTGGSFGFVDLWDAVQATTAATGTASTSIAPTGRGGTISLLLKAGGPPPVNGTAAVVLGPLTLTATGVNTVIATATVGLGALALTATGVTLITGTVTVALGTLTVAATGTVLALLAATADIGLGTLTVNAAASGTGVSGPFYVFTPPTEPYVPPVPAGGPENPPWRLMQFFQQEVLRGVNVFKMADGQYLRDDRTGVWPTTPDVPNDAISWTWSGGSALSPIMMPIDNPVLFVYYGGHSYVVDQAEADRLVLAGFGENVDAVTAREFGDGTLGDGTFAYSFHELAVV